MVLSANPFPPPTTMSLCLTYFTSTPIGIYGHKLTDEEIYHIANEDGLLSHPSPCCIGAVTCYSLAIAHLIHNPGDRRGAFGRAKLWVESQGQQMADVVGWLTDAENNVAVTYYPAPGWVKIGFTHAFRHLLLGTSYLDALKETLAGGTKSNLCPFTTDLVTAGGDTDTNACIVGGLIGACERVDAIPSGLRKAVESCDTR